MTHTTQAWVEHFARQADNSWLYREHRKLEATVTVASIDCHVRLSDLYARVLDFLERSAGSPVV